MKRILLLFILSSITLSAQTKLNFNKKFIDSEDKWVALQKDETGNYSLGFIYIDSEAGLTFNSETTFKISKDGLFIPSKKVNTGYMKVRLKNNNVKVAWIPEEKFKELDIVKEPDWLKHYKNDLKTTKRLYKWGYMYNGWGKCLKALEYLKEAYNSEPEYKGLGVEIAYSYNCLGEFEKAISIMKKVVKSDPSNSYSNKELIYAQLKSGKLQDASKSIKESIKQTDGKYNGENIYNLLYSYYELKDYNNCQKWIKKAKKWNSKNQEILNSIKTIDVKSKK